MKRIGGYKYPLLSAEQVAPPESMISGVDTIASGGVYSLDEHSRNVGWCRGMSEYMETFDSLDTAWNVSTLASATISNGTLITTPTIGTRSDGLRSGAIISIPTIYGDFDISVSVSWTGSGSLRAGFYIMLYDDDLTYIASVGINDPWAGSLAEYWGEILDARGQSGAGTVQTPGNCALRIARVSGVMSVYTNSTLWAQKTTSVPFSKICLANTRDAAQYTGYTVTWDNFYLKRGR